MCIRDSTIPGSGLSEMMIGNYREVIAADYAFTFLNQFANVCLLYPSDAADERSSVDLGGPRIIKKQKTKKYRKKKKKKINRQHEYNDKAMNQILHRKKSKEK